MRSERWKGWSAPLPRSSSRPNSSADDRSALAGFDGDRARIGDEIADRGRIPLVDHAIDAHRSSARIGQYQAVLRIAVHLFDDFAQRLAPEDQPPARPGNGAVGIDIGRLPAEARVAAHALGEDRKSTRLNSSHVR